MNKNIDPKNINASSLLNSLSAEDRKTFDRLLKDKNARDKILSSPEAKELMSKLMNGR